MYRNGLDQDLPVRVPVCQAIEAVGASAKRSGIAPKAPDRLGRQVPTRLTSDDHLASFQLYIVPQLGSAYNFARFLTSDAESAQEVVEETFFRAYQEIGSYRGGDARPWLFAMVRKCYLDGLMKRRRKRPVFARRGVTEQHPLETTPLHAVDANPVHLAVYQMPRRLREMIILREVEGLSYRQISEITALPIITITSRLACARIKLLARI